MGGIKKSYKKCIIILLLQGINKYSVGPHNVGIQNREALQGSQLQNLPSFRSENTSLPSSHRTYFKHGQFRVLGYTVK